MGWKTSIIASQRKSARLASEAVHDASLADRITVIFPGDFSFVGKSTFEYGAYPHNGNLYIGAHSDSIIVGHMDYAGSYFIGDVSRRFLGERFDSFDHDKLAMSEYKAKSKSLWQRLLGR